MFKDPKDEEEICNTLRAFCEEFGSENVVISLPQAWVKGREDMQSIGLVTLLFETNDTVELRTYLDAKQGYQFIKQLQVV